MSDPEGLLSINTPFRAYRRALWGALAVFATLLLVVLMTICSADKNAARNQNVTAETVMCDKYASTKGSDKAPGTQAAPYRSVQHLVDSLRPGQTGGILGGT